MIRASHMVSPRGTGKPRASGDDPLARRVTDADLA